MAHQAATALGSRLASLSAPPEFARWAAPFPDFGTCWQACSDPGWLLWSAARLSRSEQERREIVGCGVALAAMAATEAGTADTRIHAAITAVQDWAAGHPEASIIDACRSAVDAADEAAIQAARQASRARTLSALSPRRRLASVTASRALTARMSAQTARRRALAALATMWVTSAAAETYIAAEAPAMWATALQHAGDYAAAAIASRGGKTGMRATARCAMTIRERLPVPLITC